eukprot:153640_1
MQKKKQLNQLKETALLQILDSIHSTVYHQYDLFRTPHDNDPTNTNCDKNKLRNCFTSEQISLFLPSRTSIIRQLRMKNGKKNKFLTTVINSSDTPTARSKLSDGNTDTSDNNIEENKYDNIRHEIAIDTSYAKYHFGFCHAPHCCNENHTHKTNELTPKYSHLKAEILGNKIKAIPLTLWNSEYQKAKYLQKSDRS